jgi:hypothetical protein
VSNGGFDSRIGEFMAIATGIQQNIGRSKRARARKALVSDLVNALQLAEATIVRLERHAPGSANGTLDVVREAIRRAGGGM